MNAASAAWMCEMSEIKRITLAYVLRLCTITANEKDLAWMYAVCESARCELNLHGGYAPVSNKRNVKHRILIRKSRLKLFFESILLSVAKRVVISPRID